MNDNINWRNMVYRQVIINVINKEIMQSYIEINRSAEEIELSVFQRYSDLKAYLRRISQIILRIRSVNKRIVLFKGNVFEEQKEEELFMHLRSLIWNEIYKELLKNGKKNL